MSLVLKYKFHKIKKKVNLQIKLILILIRGVFLFDREVKIFRKEDWKKVRKELKRNYKEIHHKLKFAKT